MGDISLNVMKMLLIALSLAGYVANARAEASDAASRAEEAEKIRLLEAEIEKRIEQLNRKPKRTVITPSTREVEYAIYYTSVQRKIEQIGTLNFPKKNGQKLYGELVASIPIFHDGTIYEKEGGPKIEHSSGDPDLDRAALRIIRRAAPFGAFPKAMRSTGRDDVWQLVTRFNFTINGEEPPR
jgi:protein TonB